MKLKLGEIYYSEEWNILAKAIYSQQDYNIVLQVIKILGTVTVWHINEELCDCELCLNKFRPLNKLEKLKYL